MRVYIETDYVRYTFARSEAQLREDGYVDPFNSDEGWADVDPETFAKWEAARQASWDVEREVRSLLKKTYEKKKEGA